MKDLNNILYDIRRLDELGEQETIIHKINPSIKIVLTFIYIIKVISISEINIKDILIVLVYPLVVFILGKIPFKIIAKKLIIAMPLVLSIVIVNIFIDPSIYQIIKSIMLISKTILTVFGGLLLLASTGMNNIVIGLKKLHVPNIFIMQLSMIYRYIIVMIEEALKIKNAYSLRSSSNKGIDILDFGLILGRMLLKTIDKGENVYKAMKLRNYNSNLYIYNEKKINYKDILYLVFWMIMFI